MTLRWHPATTIGAQVSWLRHGKGVTRRTEMQHHAPQLGHERFF